MSHRRSLAHNIGLLLLLLASTATAQQPWLHCTADPLAELLRPPSAAESGSDDIQFSADQAQVSPTEAALEGEVIVEQGDLRLQAPRVVLDRSDNTVSAQDLRYGSSTLAVRADEAEVTLDAEMAEFYQAEYYLPDQHAQGSAGQVSIDRSQQQSQLQDVTYSTCARGKEFWQIRSRELELDQIKGRGIARDLSLAIKDTPILYLPYISFPINDQRQSGWLAPRLGYDDGTGLDLQFAYYWNIAPDQDATFYPRVVSKRGLMLGAEYRFLNHHDNGQIRLEYLPYDDELGNDRGAFFIQHRSHFLSNLYTDLLYQYVSDDNYIIDLDNTLDLFSPDYLERHFDLVYHGANWTALARLQGFQTLDNDLFNLENEPYERLPQFRFDGVWPQNNYGLDYELRSELVHFEHDTLNTGTRLDIDAGASLPLNWPWGFVKPSLSYRYTAYDLAEGVSVDKNTGSQTPNRAAPVVSMDGGVFFERSVDWPLFGEGIQTLEPRLFYLYVPFQEHVDIPLFDTTEVDRSFSWLFLSNRFVGADRLGDANQLTTAVSSRFLAAADGRERLRFSIGQVHYFRDREVTLNNNEPDLDNTSDIIGEAQVALNTAIDLRGAWQWDPDQNQTGRSTLDLRFRPDSQRLLNLSHRYARDDLEQVDLAFIWPIKDSWRALGRWNYSLREERSLDVLAGFEYSDCCWALRLMGRRHRDDPQTDEISNSVFLELELKGLSSIGNRIDNLLEEAILGYEPVSYR